MKRILMSLIVAMPLAGCGDNPDRTYSDVTAAAHDCGKERSVAVNGSGGNFTFTGTCESVTVTGEANKLTIESVKSIRVDGAKNSLQIGAVDRISVNGSDNTVKYRKGLPGPSPYAATASGNNNVVEQAK